MNSVAAPHDAESLHLGSEREACGFTQDARLAWVTTTNEAHLFAPHTWQSFARIEPKEGYFVGTVISGDDRELVTVIGFRTLQRWPLDPVAYARSVVPRDFEPDEIDQLQLGEPAERIDRMERIARATPTAARAVEVLRRAGELGVKVETMTRVEDFDALRAAPGFQAMLAEGR